MENTGALSFQAWILKRGFLPFIWERKSPVVQITLSWKERNKTLLFILFLEQQISDLPLNSLFTFLMYTMTIQKWIYRLLQAEKQEPPEIEWPFNPHTDPYPSVSPH